MSFYSVCRAHLLSNRLLVFNLPLRYNSKKTLSPSILSFPNRHEVFSTHHDRLSSLPSSHGASPSQEKIYVNFNIYKGKSALNAYPIKPVFKRNNSGHHSVQKEGGLMLEFSNAIGLRKYDWENKQLFCLNTFELGKILCLKNQDTVDFFHDPNKGKITNLPSINKILKIMPTNDLSGFYFQISVKKDNKENRISVPITHSELAVLRNCINFIVPYLMGWHVFTNPSTIEEYDLETKGGISLPPKWE